MQREVGVKARGQFFTIDFRTQEHGRSDVMQLRASIRRFIVFASDGFLALLRCNNCQTDETQPTPVQVVRSRVAFVLHERSSCRWAEDRSVGESDASSSRRARPAAQTFPAQAPTMQRCSLSWAIDKVTIGRRRTNS
jgi:hypothetical protein